MVHHWAGLAVAFCTWQWPCGNYFASGVATEACNTTSWRKPSVKSDGLLVESSPNHKSVYESMKRKRPNKLGQSQPSRPAGAKPKALALLSYSLKNRVQPVVLFQSVLWMWIPIHIVTTTFDTFNWCEVHWTLGIASWQDWQYCCFRKNCFGKVNSYVKSKHEKQSVWWPEVEAQLCRPCDSAKPRLPNKRTKSRLRCQNDNGWTQ